jgi:hypothetical protein
VAQAVAEFESLSVLLKPKGIRHEKRLSELTQMSRLLLTPRRFMRFKVRLTDQLTDARKKWAVWVFEEMTVRRSFAMRQSA